MRTLSGVNTLLAACALVAVGCAGGSRPEGSAEEAPATGDRQRLAYTAIPDQNTTELEDKFRPLSEHLGRELGVEVAYVPARDYQASVEMFVNGDVGLAWFGGLTGVQARERVPGARAVAQGDVDPRYYSYFIAHQSTGLQRSEEFPRAIAGYRFTFGSESSTSGRLMPEYFIRKETGNAPSEFFQHPVGFSGGHDKTAELVATGQYQVGVINYKVYDQRVEQKKTDPEVVRVVWQTPPYADYNWTVRPDLDTALGDGFTERLAKALLAIEDPALLAALPRDRLVPASNEEFEGIRAVARQLDMLQ